MKRVGVIVGPHVVERLVERFGHEFRAGRDHVSLIFAEVNEGIRAGRKSKTKPSWASHVSRTSSSDGSRYVWNREQTRVYVIVRLRKDQIHDHEAAFDESWVVKTVLPHVDNNDEFTAHRRRYIEEAHIRRRRFGRPGKGKR